MAIARYYKVGVFDSATPTAQGGTVATTTPTPILWGTTTATNDCNISAIRVSCLGAASFPSNASFAASINLTTGTVAGGNAATPVLLSGALAGNTTWKTAGGSTSSLIISGLTEGKFYWSQDIPFTAGANWAEWFSPGFEINIPASTGFAVYITESSGGTATTFAAELEYTE